MDTIGKTALLGGIFLVISMIYVNLPSTKRNIHNFDDRKLFQKNEKFKMLWKIFLALGFITPIVLIFPLFSISQSKIVEMYLSSLVLISICLIIAGMIYLNLAKISTAEIEYRKSRK
jgi:hypothetical protein